MHHAQQVLVWPFNGVSLPANVSLLRLRVTVRALKQEVVISSSFIISMLSVVDPLTQLVAIFWLAERWVCADQASVPTCLIS